MLKLTFQDCDELRNIGFIQKTEGMGIFPSGETVNASFLKNSHNITAVYMPSLEELIEGCGLQFCTLEKCIPNELCAWRAIGIDRKGDVEETGDSPIQAVKKLYINLYSRYETN